MEMPARSSRHFSFRGRNFRNFSPSLAVYCGGNPRTRRLSRCRDKRATGILAPCRLRAPKGRDVQAPGRTNRMSPHSDPPAASVRYLVEHVAVVGPQGEKVFPGLYAIGLAPQDVPGAVDQRRIVGHDVPQPRKVLAVDAPVEPPDDGGWIGRRFVFFHRQRFFNRSPGPFRFRSCRGSAEIHSAPAPRPVGSFPPVP